MPRTSDPVTEADLMAYVDGELDFARKVEVEGHLAGDPALASRIMGELRTRGELRLALAEPSLPDDATTSRIAEALRRTLRRRRPLRRLMRAATVVLLIGGGWIATDRLGLLDISPSVASAPPPAFVLDALASFRTTSLRNHMPSQTEVKRYDREEILSATAIHMPDLPQDWVIDDVQVFPSTYGPSVSVAIETDDLGRVALHAARPGTVETLPIGAVQDGLETAAFWQEADVAYALVATAADRARVELEAGRIQRSLP